jgi:type VI secretion system protein ImpM
MSPQALYFGKVPSRGDFVRSSSGSVLIQSIDQWLSKTLTLWIEDLGWKAIYDAAAPVHFAIFSTQGHAGLVGHIAASQDASGRRFPFVAATSFEVPNPDKLIPYCAHAFAPLWMRFDAAVRQALSTEDFACVQDQLIVVPSELVVDANTIREQHQQFLQTQTIGEFEATLNTAEQPFSFRQTLLALGLLLQPVLTQANTSTSKALVFPLPTHPRLLPAAITLWINLVNRFFKKKSVELALFVTTQRQRAVLVVGFQGSSAVTLLSVWDADVCQRDNVAVSEAAWVEAELDHAQPGLRALSNLLLDPTLSLDVAIETFNKTFFGD